MAFINEEIEHISGLVIEILEYEGTEMANKQEICSLDFSNSLSTRMTPSQIEDLGHWLIKQSNYVRNNFSKTGKPKKK